MTQQWLNLIQLYGGLTEFGFSEGMPRLDDGRVRRAQFLSANFVLVVGIDELMQEISVFWLDTKTNTAIPEPLLGLCYFFGDIETLIARYPSPMNLLDRHRTTMDLYRENPVIISTNAWMSDPGFCDALKAVNEWMWKEFRVLEPWEFERALHALRPAEPSV
jgi:hypothetical protein